MSSNLLLPKICFLLCQDSNPPQLTLKETPKWRYFANISSSKLINVEQQVWDTKQTFKDVLLVPRDQARPPPENWSTFDRKPLRQGHADKNDLEQKKSRRHFSQKNFFLFRPKIFEGPFCWLISLQRVSFHSGKGEVLAFCFFVAVNLLLDVQEE